MNEERILLEHILTTLDQFHEVSRSTSKSLADLSARLNSLELLLKTVNATLHEGINGKEPILARLALLERPPSEDEARTEAAKGKWKVWALLASGGLALLAQMVQLLWKVVAG